MLSGSKSVQRYRDPGLQPIPGYQAFFTRGRVDK